LLVGHARGEYFKWASSNDLCDRTFIEKCVGVLDSRPDVSLCYPRTKLFVDNPDEGREYDVQVSALDEDAFVRFRSVLEHIRLNNAINGLIRMTVLRQTGLIRSHYASDITLLAEIALRGKLLELPEFLFFRRFDAESVTALQDASALQQVHFPRPGVGMLFQTWRRCWGYSSALSHAELTLSQRARGYAYVAKTWHWAIPRLWAELKEAVGTLGGTRSVSGR
jgi:hypothetical protein